MPPMDFNKTWKRMHKLVPFMGLLMNDPYCSIDENFTTEKEINIICIYII